MTTTTDLHPRRSRGSRPAPPAPRRRILAALDRPADLIAHVTPNWFASVMGTGIVANAAATLPIQPTGLRTFAVAIWLLASVALITLSAAFGAHWWRHTATARQYAAHPVMSQFYGAPPMAMLTVGAGTLLVGRDLIGAHLAVLVDAILWTAGTATGLATSLWVPFRMITVRDRTAVTPLPAWLMPIVPPMVSASTGALLLPHVPAGQLRLTLMMACYAMFGLSLIIGMITMTMIYTRLVHTGMPSAQAAPTIWITLGMIGQSITAANLLGGAASSVLGPPFADGLRVFGLVFGLVMGGFGMLMFALATALTMHAARADLPFSLTWWSFTFPIGTCVTAATSLGATAGAGILRALAVLLWAILLTAWTVVATRTLRRSITGEIFRPVH